ncbi:MAG: hypothetical protein AAFX87_24535 [Bacteroidota bacterium]
MSTFNQNFKFLRENVAGLSMSAFGKVFELTKGQVDSYEKSSQPKIEKYLEILNHFKIDPEKFATLDMRVHNVFKNNDMQEEDSLSNAKNRQGIPGLSEDQELRFLDDIENIEELKHIFRQEWRMNKELKAENQFLSWKVIKLSDELREGSQKK